MVAKSLVFPLKSSKIQTFLISHVRFEAAGANYRIRVQQHDQGHGFEYEIAHSHQRRSTAANGHASEDVDEQNFLVSKIAEILLKTMKIAPISIIF